MRLRCAVPTLSPGWVVMRARFSSSKSRVSNVVKVADRLVTEISKPDGIDGGRVDVGLSIGVTKRKWPVAEHTVSSSRICRTGSKRGDSAAKRLHGRDALRRGPAAEPAGCLSTSEWTDAVGFARDRRLISHSREAVRDEHSPWFHRAMCGGVVRHQCVQRRRRDGVIGVAAGPSVAVRFAITAGHALVSARRRSKLVRRSADKRF